MGAEIATEAAQGLPYRLGAVKQIPVGEARVGEVEGKSIAVFRARRGEARGRRRVRIGRHLADGIIGGGQVVYPPHAYKFELATGRPVGNECDCPGLMPRR